MRKKRTESKLSLQVIERELDMTQKLNSIVQYEVRGGCTPCEDSRRPPRY